MAKVLISMREDFLNMIDDLADDEQRSRSELIRQALRVYMRKRKQQPVSTSDLLESILLD